jgi:hypothetical protein
MPSAAAAALFDAERSLTAAEVELVSRARLTAHTLYAGVRVAHRSCGIALAETFGLPSRPYQALRRGGLTGEGQCGAIKAGELVLGELLGDPDPAGGVTAELAAAVRWYQGAWHTRIERNGAPDIICNDLTRPLGDFSGPARRDFCTNLAAEIAALCAEALVRVGRLPVVAALPER